MVTEEQYAALRRIYPDDEVHFLHLDDNGDPDGSGDGPGEKNARFDNMRYCGDCTIIFLVRGQSIKLTFGNQPKEFDLLIWKNGRLKRVTAIHPVTKEYQPASLQLAVVRTRADGSPTQPGDTSWQCSDGGRE